MKVISKLQTLSNFPFVSKENIEKEIIKLQRHINFEELRTEHHKIFIAEQKELSFYRLLMEQLSSSQPIDELVALLSLNEEDDELIQEIVSYWKERFLSGLSEEEHPLTLLVLLEEKASNPILMVALIQVLLERQISAKALLDSGLLHRYCVAHVEQISEIQKVYELLSTVSYSSTELNWLLEQANIIEIPSALGLGVNLTLSGKIKSNQAKTPFTPPQDAPLFSFTVTSTNWKRLYDFLGPFFFLKVLLDSHSQRIETLLLDKVNALPTGIIFLLYKNIQTKIAEEHRFALLKKLSQYLSDEQAMKVLKLKEVSLWIMLTSRPKLFKNLSEKMLLYLIKQHLVTSQDFVQALQCAKKPQLLSYQEHIYEQVLIYLMHHHSIDIPDKVIQDFKSNRHTGVLCERLHHSLLSDFQKDIKENLPLSSHSLISIMDSYRVKLKQWHVLQKLSPVNLHYPQDTHEAQSFIINEMSQTGQLTLECFDFFHFEASYENYTSDALQKQTQRKLLACLIVQSNEALHEWVIQTLKTTFFISNWQECTINEQALLVLAIEYENTTLIRRYFSDKGLNEILQKNEKKETLLHRAITYPKSLNFLISLYPEPERLGVLKEKDQYGNTLLYKAANHPEALRIILSFYPENEHLPAVKEKDRDGDRLLHRTVNHPEALELILSLYPENERLIAITEKNQNGTMLLHRAIYNPESLKIILSLLPEHERLSAVKEKDQSGNAILHRIANIPETLELSLSLLPEHERLEAVKEKNSNDDTVLHKAANNAEALELILSLYPEHKRLTAIKEKNDNEDTVLHKAASNAEALKLILSLYPENERLTAIKEKNKKGDTLLHSAAAHPEALELILSFYPEQERLVAVKEKNSNDDSVLHRAASNDEALELILSFYPENERLTAVKEKNKNGNSVLHRAANHPKSLEIILSLYPEQERFAAITEKDRNGDTLLHKAFRNPEALKMILSLLPEHERLAAVNEKNKNGDTVLHRIANDPEALKMILSLLPEHERLTAIKEKNRNGNTVLHIASKNIESVKMILSLLLEVPFNVLVKSGTDLKFIIPEIKKVYPLKLLPIAQTFLSDEYKTEAHELLLSNDSEAFLSHYFKLSDILARETEPALHKSVHWFRELLTGKSNYSSARYKTNEPLLSQNPLTREILKTPSIQAFLVNLQTPLSNLVFFKEKPLQNSNDSTNLSYNKLLN